MQTIVLHIPSAVLPISPKLVRWEKEEENVAMPLRLLEMRRRALVEYKRVTLDTEVVFQFEINMN